MKRQYNSDQNDDDDDDASSNPAEINVAADTDESKQPDQPSTTTTEEEVEQEQEELSFMDTFYGLSSTNATERAHAAQVMLQHCLTGPAANTQDAAYALKRLLNALCSGRAAARQGNASALTAFLNIAMEKGVLREIQELQAEEEEEEDADEEEESGCSVLQFVRQRLLQVTDPGESNARGSVERDYKFGRLFGILSVVKSGILCPVGTIDDSSLQDLVAVAVGFGQDLVDLYEYKKWMREPAAHAICIMLNILYALGPSNAGALEILENIVKKVILPKLLVVKDDKNVPSAYSAEQIAVAIHLQAHLECHPTGFSAPLDKAMLSLDTIPAIAQALSETSVVTQPRTHLVWDVIWDYLTESDASKRNVTIRKPRKATPVANESVDDVLNALMRSAVIERLLGMENSEEAKSKTTHERRALALCLVRNLVGVEFVSSVAGRTKLVMGPHIVETIALEPVLVRRLFIDTIGAGKGGQKKQADHMLKPLAMHILESMVAQITPEVDESTNEMRLAVLKALLRCDSRFDSRLKVTTVQSLLETNASKLDEFFWDQFILFVEGQILRSEPEKGAETNLSLPPYETIGYIDLLFHVAKTSLKMERELHEKNSKEGLKMNSSKLARRVLEFLMVCAFFDCRDLKETSEQTETTDWSFSNKKKKRKSKGHEEATPQILNTAMSVKCARPGDTSCLTFGVRTVASSRFFSLLSELVAAVLHSAAEDKEFEVLCFLSEIRKSCKILQVAGAHTLQSREAEDMETEEKSPEEIVNTLCENAGASGVSVAEKSKEVARKRLHTGLALLSSVLYLQLLNCGLPEDTMEENLDTDVEEDREEVESVLSEMFDLFKRFQEEKNSELIDDEVFLGITELCTNILSSPIGGGSQIHGSAPKLLRDAIKATWTRTLTFASTFEDPKLSPDVVPLLLQAVGAASGSGDESGEEESAMDSEEGDEDVNELGNHFAKAAELSDTNEKSSGEGSDSERQEESDEEIELDPTRLQSLLEQEVDDESVASNELEHHEGADAALAKLIQLKQDARKAGQKARERLEITRQLRCTLLLETLVSGKPEGWASLLRVDTLLELAIALLRYRNELEKSVSKAGERGLDGSLGEKKAMLDRLSAILKTKLLKAKVSQLEWNEGVDVAKFGNKVASLLLKEARHSDSKEQRHLCSNTILFLIRGLSANDDKVRVASVYANAVNEWATKRTARFDANFFDQLIQQAPAVAQVSITEALVEAASTSRSSFLKSEAFRLLSQLYSHKINSSNTAELEELGQSRICGASSAVLQAISSALKDEDMRKAKRAREVLRATENLVNYLSSTTSTVLLDTSQLNEVMNLIGTVQDGTESRGIGNTCEKLLDQIKNLIARQQERDDEEKPHVAKQGFVEPEQSCKPAKTKKKKKSKSSKKKRH